MKHSILGLFAFAGISLSTGVASADYVCSTQYAPGSSGHGTYGNVSYTLYTGANCTGTLVGTFYLVSAGCIATTVCPLNQTYWAQSREQMASIAEGLRLAAMGNHPVTAINGQCQSGSGVCAYTVRYD